jgi:hypothetical protein
MTDQSDQPSTSAVAGSPRRPSSGGGRLLIVGGVAGVAFALVKFIASYRIPQPAGGNVAFEAVVAGLIALVMTGTGLAYLRRIVVPPTMSLVVSLIVLIVAMCGLPCTTRLLSDIQYSEGLSHEKYREVMDALAGATPAWFTYLTYGFAGLQVVTCLVASSLISRDQSPRKAGRWG